MQLTGFEKTGKSSQKKEKRCAYVDIVVGLDYRGRVPS